MANLLDREHYEGNVLDAIRELRARIEALERTDLSGVAGPQGPTGETGATGPTGSPGPGAPSPLTQGDVLVVDSTPEITTLGIGNAHEILKVNAAGTDPNWEPFDWDEMSGVGGADMAHDHSSAAEGGQFLDLNGAADALVLDADGDTSLSAPTDDEIDIEVGGSDIAEWKAGGLYLILSKDIYPDGDDYGLWSRRVNLGRVPDEHYRNGGEDLTWTGWAAYTGFVTPDQLSYPASVQLYRHDAADYKRAFRYRTISTGTLFALWGRVAVSFGCEIGLMVDDGADTGDGEGADNFVRFVLRSTGPGVDNTLRCEYRVGGGAVVTTTAMTFIATEFVAIRMIVGFGTPWTNWWAGCYYRGEHGEEGAFSYDGAFTWTPSRVGIYWRAITVAATYPRGFADWYEELQ